MQGEKGKKGITFLFAPTQKLVSSPHKILRLSSASLVLTTGRSPPNSLQKVLAPGQFREILKQWKDGCFIHTKDGIVEAGALKVPVHRYIY